MAEKPLEEIYEGFECGKCGGPIEPGIWCGNDDCVLGNEGPPMRTEE